MESREERFKKYREEIAQQDKKIDFEKLDSAEVLDQPQEETIKKNTLTMSIDQLIEAHDEYTMIIKQKELKNKLKQEKKEKRKTQLVNVLKYCAIGLGLLLLVVILVVIFVQIL